MAPRAIPHPPSPRLPPLVQHVLADVVLDPDELVLPGQADKHEGVALAARSACPGRPGPAAPILRQRLGLRTTRRAELEVEQIVGDLLVRGSLLVGDLGRPRCRPEAGAVGT